jgi:uncharacterized BrkB/YihY/UPF0761 family membrane protein
MTDLITTQRSFRRFQLKAMGFTAILIGPAVLIATMLIHGLPFPKSISETATIANQTAPILPFCLGALALFALTYAIAHSYDRMDRILTAGMFTGFTIVALQMCKSQYVVVHSVGVLGLSQSASNLIHTIGAITGFGCMIFWIMTCFTKSDKKLRERTKEKRVRDNIYFWLGLCMMLSLSLFIYNRFGLFGSSFPVVFVTECLMLTFGGAACLIKSGMVLGDK